MNTIKKSLILVAVTAISMNSMQVSAQGKKFGAPVHHPPFAGEGPEVMKERMMKRFTKQYDLTSAQQKKIEALINEKHVRIKKMHDEMKKLKDQFDSEVEAVLTDKQKVKFRANLAKRKARRAEFKTQFKEAKKEIKQEFKEQRKLEKKNN